MLDNVVSAFCACLCERIDASAHLRTKISGKNIGLKFGNFATAFPSTVPPYIMLSTLKRTASNVFSIVKVAKVRKTARIGGVWSVLVAALNAGILGAVCGRYSSPLVSIAV